MPGTGARTFSQVIGYRPQPLTVPTFANSWCRPRSDTPASDQALVPLFAKNPPYRSNGEPVSGEQCGKARLVTKEPNPRRRLAQMDGLVQKSCLERRAK